MNHQTIVVSVDLGTTKITALALDTGTGAVRASATQPNRAETTPAELKRLGYSEWDARQMADLACACLRDVADRLGERRRDIAGLGITGQQHGVVVVDEGLTPLVPFVNWQDRRGEALVPDAVARLGPDAPERMGCRLAAGYLGLTLFWWQQNGVLPAGKACFLMDYFAALLTGEPPVTEPTCAASSGIFDVAAGEWSRAAQDALGLPAEMFPRVQAANQLAGRLSSALSAATGLPAGLPVCVGIGDNQASFLGSVGDPVDAVLVNVGTGGQVATYTDRFHLDPLLETRPFPLGGYLLVAAGLAGGTSYALLERFFRSVGTELFGIEAKEPLFDAMNRLAAGTGSAGVHCEPLFNGTRARPELRASFTELSTLNFTPAHLTRALLEGMARTFHSGYQRMQQRRRLIGAGNGLRDNPLFAALLAERFGLPLYVTRHREEAAYGAALVAATALGVFSDLSTAGRLIEHDRF